MELVTPTPEDKPLIDRLAELYAYDFSEVTGLTIRPDGLFPRHECFTEIWTDPNRIARIIRQDGEVAGLAIVHRIEADDYDMEQFLILRKLRRSGLGRAAATALFRSFPGRWTVEQVPANTGAVAFWRRVISDFTVGDFDDKSGELIVQTFVT